MTSEHLAIIACCYVAWAFVFAAWGFEVGKGTRRYEQFRAILLLTAFVPPVGLLIILWHTSIYLVKTFASLVRSAF